MAAPASDEECRSFQPRRFRFRQVTRPLRTMVLHEVASLLPHAVLWSVRVAVFWAALCFSPVHAAPPAPRD
ncbi:MAG: hypothetical protein ACKOJF_19375, partial [Planctomycetaceae bacterium]